MRLSALEILLTPMKPKTHVQVVSEAKNDPEKAGTLIRRIILRFDSYQNIKRLSKHQNKPILSEYLDDADIAFMVDGLRSYSIGEATTFEAAFHLVHKRGRKKVHNDDAISIYFHQQKTLHNYEHAVVATAVKFSISEQIAKRIYDRAKRPRYIVSHILLGKKPDHSHLDIYL